MVSLEGYAPLKLPVYYSQSNQTSFRLWVLPLIKDLRRDGSLNLNTVRIYLQEKYSKLIEETMLGYTEEQLTLVGAEA